MVDIVVGQIWRPTNGEPGRQIDQYRVATISDGYPLGTLLVCWVAHAGKSGWCSDQSFKAWIRRTKASPL